MEQVFILFSIVIINMLLSGDNALVIALACRRLSESQQKKAMIWGSIGAVGLRVALTFIAVFLLKIPYLQFLGGGILLVIGAKLIGSDHKQRENIQAASTMSEAIKTIIVADLVMSIDNVIAIAGAAKGNTVLLIIGIAISIPIVIWGSKLIMILMNKFPPIVVIGTAFLGWVAGEMMVSDVRIIPFVHEFPQLHYIVPGICVVLIIIIGKLLANRKQQRKIKQNR